MRDSRFFTNQGPLSLAHILQATGALCALENAESRMFHDVASLEAANAEHITFLDNPKYKMQLAETKAGACLLREKHAPLAPPNTIALLCDDPYAAYAVVAALFYPPLLVQGFIHPSAVIAPTAHIAGNVHIAAGVVIGDDCIIGNGCIIGANSVIERGVSIGDNSHIGPLCSISHALIGMHVMIHRGVHIGQDGFGFAMSAKGHLKVPQLGRVLIGNHVEIGSGTTIDRGAGPDTVIELGVKIDNLVQIGHNVHIEEHAVIVSQTGISGSTRIGKGAILAGQTGVAGHLTIGAGARVAAKSGIMGDIPAGTNVGGYPAVAIKDWHRQTAILSKLIRTKRGSYDG
jgi:UDP-3-O-[3-hydroxymyristoyl] glucosamine N-acyltransferase